MKKILLTLLAVLMASLAAHADVTINSTNFPDANFRSYLLSQYPSGTITTSQLNARDSLYLYNKGISDLKGVEYFTQLTYLMCYSNNLTSVDVSQNTKLTYLNLGYNKLTSINVSSNTALQELSVWDRSSVPNMASRPIPNRNSPMPRNGDRISGRKTTATRTASTATRRVRHRARPLVLPISPYKAT